MYTSFFDLSPQSHTLSGTYASLGKKKDEHIETKKKGKTTKSRDLVHKFFEKEPFCARTWRLSFLTNI